MLYLLPIDFIFCAALKEDINKLREENKKELDDLKISLNTMEGLLKKGDITIEELNKIINREI
jgi:hypothetical protein